MNRTRKILENERVDEKMPKQAIVDRQGQVNKQRHHPCWPRNVLLLLPFRCSAGVHYICICLNIQEKQEARLFSNNNGASHSFRLDLVS